MSHHPSENYRHPGSIFVYISASLSMLSETSTGVSRRKVFLQRCLLVKSSYNYLTHNFSQGVGLHVFLVQFVSFCSLKRFPEKPKIYTNTYILSVTKSLYKPTSWGENRLQSVSDTKHILWNPF